MDPIATTDTLEVRTSAGCTPWHEVVDRDGHLDYLGERVELHETLHRFVAAKAGTPAELADATVFVISRRNPERGFRVVWCVAGMSRRARQSILPAAQTLLAQHGFEVRSTGNTDERAVVPAPAPHTRLDITERRISLRFRPGTSLDESRREMRNRQPISIRQMLNLPAPTSAREVTNPDRRRSKRA